MDQIQSEYPAHTGSATASGYFYAPASLSDSCPILLSVPSSKWFKPRTIWIHNRAAVQNELLFYTGGSNAVCSASLGGVWVGPRETAFIAIDGITVGGDIHVSALVATVAVRITGILLQSGPE